MDHEDKESKTYVVKVKRYDSGMPDKNKWIHREARYDNELGAGNADGKKFGSVFDGETRTRSKK
jgi:hypothetical protein